MSIQARIERARHQRGQQAGQGGAEEGGRQQTSGPFPSDSLKERLLVDVIAALDQEGGPKQGLELERQVEVVFDRLMAEQSIVLGRRERQALLDSLIDEIMGYGPVQAFLNDSTVDEIMVNGPDHIYIEREGKIEKTQARFDSDEHVMRIIERIVSPLGRRIDESQPYVDARLPDGSRVNVIIPPLALNGPTVTIRKFARSPFTVQQLIDRSTFTPEFVQFVKACVEGKLNIVISGGTGTGKTTLLNIISAFIPNDERIITIEDAAELQLRQEHVISLESRPKNIEGKGEVTRGDLVVNALRMRPDRIIVGECRSKEAIDMLQAMNTGHEGSMTTVHANSPRDGLHRLETMVMMAGYDLPLRAIREQIASALDLMVHLERMKDGTRRVTSVVEIQGMEGDVITSQEIFRFQPTGQHEGRILGKLAATGTRPKFMEKVETAGIRLPPTVFGLDPRIYRS